MSIQAVNDATFRQHVEARGVALVDFSAQWCPPCKVLLPILDELKAEYGEQISVLYVDCDESPAVAAEYGVMSMPTVVLFRNGEPVEKLIGLRPKGVYEALLTRYLQTQHA